MMDTSNCHYKTPPVIASGNGFNAYGHYRLTYDKATTWDDSLSTPLDNGRDGQDVQCMATLRLQCLLRQPHTAQ